MNEFLRKQFYLLTHEELIEDEEFEKLVEEAKNNVSSEYCRICLIEEWAHGHYIKLNVEYTKFPHQTGEIVTLIGKIILTSTILFDNGNCMIVFTSDNVNLLSLGDKFRIINGCNNGYTFLVHNLTIVRVSMLLNKNRFLKNVINGIYTKNEKKKLKLDYKLQLDKYQKEAIEHAIKSKDFACIWGPPGTGKTTTLSELIHQLVISGETVLVSCPSNFAVDLIYSKTVSIGVSCVRVGRGAVIKELQLKMATIESLKNFYTENSYSTILNTNQGSYSKRMQLLKKARAIFTTCLGTSSKEIQNFINKYRKFDTLIIDESGNSLESTCYIGMLTGVKRVVFAGDHFQLPPIVKSRIKTSSILERLYLSCPNSFVMLKRQYRMNQQIVKWSNNQFYSNKLESDSSVKNSVLNERMVDFYPPLIWYEIEGMEEFDSGSIFNKLEASYVLDYVKIISSTAGIHPECITVITPYRAQARLLQELIGVTTHNLRISSIDASQGFESDVVIFSLVSCNSEGNIGFLSDYRRMNVAITRGKRHVAVFGSANTFQRNHSPYKDLLKVVKFGRCWWRCHFLALRTWRDSIVYFINYLIKTYGNIPIKTTYGSNGYMKSSNLRLAEQCKYGNITYALQYLTPNPISNIIMAICLLYTLNGSISPLFHRIDDKVIVIYNNININAGSNSVETIDLSWMEYYMKVITNSLASSNRLYLLEVFFYNINLLFTLFISFNNEHSIKNITTELMESRLIDTSYGLENPDTICGPYEIGKLDENVTYTNYVSTVSKKKKKKKKKKKDNYNDDNVSNIGNFDLEDNNIHDDTDLDVLLDELHRCNLNANKNNVTKCEKSTLMYGITCKLCKLKFCIEHRSPEKHNCNNLDRKR